LPVLDKQFEFKYYLFHSRINDLQVKSMDINYFKEFVVLAQTGNFMEAADILYSSQSALSKHIKSMELELGVPLFDRTTRKVKISKYGQLLLPYARQITEIQDKYTALLKSNLETDRDVLNLGSIYGLAQYHITDVLVKFKKNRPQSTLNVMQASSRDLKEMLRQGKCELAFIRDIEDPEEEFVKIPYATDSLVAVLPIAHPLAKEKTIPLNKIKDENFLLEVPNTMPYRLSIKACELSGFEPKVTVTDIDREYLIDLVSEGMGVSLMLKQILLHFSDPKITTVDITPNVSTQISLCYLKEIELSDAANYFVSCAESIMN
jgi:LysR family transcriptional activator of glutamate synthase operon